MDKKIFLLLMCIFIGASVSFAGPGRHTGEQAMLGVSIDFLAPAGKTVTDSSGVTYHHRGGYITSEAKVYPQQYWGEYPLYYVGELASIIVTVTNNGPRAKAKIRIRTEAYVLNTDGSSGMTLMAPREMEYEISRGATQTIDASFSIQYQPGMESGLDRFLVKVLHSNEGTGGSSGNEPGLIMAREGVFCPPPR